MNLIVLQQEIALPEYDGMTAAETVSVLNEADRPKNVESMTASAVLQSVDQSEYSDLTDTGKRAMWDVLHMGGVNPWGVEAGLFSQIFGAESNTIAALQVARITYVSRAQELGLPKVRTSDILKAWAEE